MAKGRQARIQHILQKGEAIDRKIKVLDDLLEVHPVDVESISLRLDDITVQFRDVSRGVDELVELAPQHEFHNKFAALETRYYNAAAKIKRLRRADLNATVANATIAERHDAPKLPIINIPSFGGNHDEWLAFKNSFEDLIDSRVDISDMVKFAHLKNALKDEALVKVSIFSLSGENYRIAWKTLNEAYNRRRLLAAKHLDALIDLPSVTKATATNLTKMMDEAKQHLHMLGQLHVSVGEDLIVRLLSKRLPVATRKKWEENLDLDKLPTLAELYKFIENNIFKLRALEQEFPTNTESRKRPAEKSQPLSNTKRSNINYARTLVTATNIDCAKCRQKHNLYACPEFNKLALQERWDFVKAKQICRNCLRPHPQPCKNNGRCKKCQREHHTILHTDKVPKKYQSKDSETTDPISNSKVESHPSTTS